MDITGDMPDSIWIEGQSNLPGLWLSIHYPNFLYCSSCSMIGHSWEYCKKRKGVSSPKPIHEKDSDPKPKAVQKSVSQSNTANNLVVANVFQVLLSIDEEDSEDVIPDNQAIVMEIDNSKTTTQKIVNANPQAISNAIDSQKDINPPKSVEIEDNITV
ncbi:hypothetical protein FRX31_029794 [Thalictrum thalictroides]|uniref:Uncharacterized protein n=1 Tax=Thalictrum thalictroides TaxID=46969 RepID=A0A7J6V6A5_THATH|nr:hypothetical protein FRX31_029794 [Thalictrum thalictroides]